ncbi:hypothetical protein GCM10010912_49360 [Paenibacillus albidus]|uniref:Uncharacterized protein n=1 Tax=Paenibacillus albidus TaxID=2041023 RepID=A0A917CW84_9BACL|nr:hypothetical protein GCM10010912_49360 [Paenibacillus albidus]
MPYIEGEDRHQIQLLPNTLDDFVEKKILSESSMLTSIVWPCENGNAKQSS